MNAYKKTAQLFKVLSDANRLRILELLSCGELCACQIQKHFSFSQPTLSHHMKTLVECGLVSSRKEGVWNHYTLNQEPAQALVRTLEHLLSDTEDCPCRMPDSSSQCSRGACESKADAEQDNDFIK